MTNWLTQLTMFGEHHKTVLAELAEVDKRTVQRWCNGSVDVPEWVIDKLEQTHNIWKDSYDITTL